MSRKCLAMLPFAMLALACSGLLASIPRVSYPGASAISMDEDERAAAFAEMFTSAYYGFESRTTFAATEDSGDDVQDYFDASLEDSDWAMMTEDWIETSEDRFFSVWTRDSRYGAIVMLADDLHSDDLDYFENEIDIQGLERGQTLIVTQTWDIEQMSTRGSEPPPEWDEETLDDLGVRIYVPGEWSVDESYADHNVALSSDYAFLYRVDEDNFGPYSFDFSGNASASHLVESFIDEQDFDALGEIESVSTGAGQGSRGLFEIERGRYGYIAVLPVEDEAIVLVSTRGYSADEDWVRMNFAVLDAVFASIRLDS